MVSKNIWRQTNFHSIRQPCSSWTALPVPLLSLVCQNVDLGIEEEMIRASTFSIEKGKFKTFYLSVQNRVQIFNIESFSQLSIYRLRKPFVEYSEVIGWHLQIVLRFVFVHSRLFVGIAMLVVPFAKPGLSFSNIICRLFFVVRRNEGVYQLGLMLQGNLIFYPEACSYFRSFVRKSWNHVSRQTMF